MLRLATFNIENLGGDENPPLEQRVKALRPVLLRLNADILCLQEVNSERLDKERQLFSLIQLLEGTIYEKYHIIHTLGTSGGHLSDKHNLVTLSKYPLLEQKQIFHDFIQGPLYKSISAYPHQEQPAEIHWDRPILYTKIELPGYGPLHVLNLHLRAPLASFVEGQKNHQIWRSVAGWAEGYYIASMKRAGQALEARLFVDQILEEDPDSLIAVCGDYNAEEYEVPTRILTAAETDTGTSKLASLSLIPIEHTLPINRRFTVLHHGRPQMLDHILISQELYAYYKDIEIHNEIIGDELAVFEDASQTARSNHAPILAKFKL